MSFHDVQLDPAISYGAQGGPSYETVLQTTASRHEYRISRTAAPRRRYTFGKDSLEVAAWAALLAFVAARRGHLHSFRFKDWLDYTSNADGRTAPTNLDQVIGTGDGTTTQFQLLKTYDPTGDNPEVRPITLPVSGSVTVAIDGSPTSSYTINSVGVLTFSSAPTVGQVITAGYEFDVPVRFDLPQEWASIELSEGLLANWGRIGCIEVLDEVQTPELWYPGGSSGTVAISSAYTLDFGTELWVFSPTGTCNINLPSPANMPGGSRIFTIINAGAGSLQVKTEAGSNLGTAFGAGTKRVMLSRDTSTWSWHIA